MQLGISADAEEWGEPIHQGKFPITSDWVEVRFDKPVKGRFLRLLALTPHDPVQEYVSIAEIEVLSD